MTNPIIARDTLRDVINAWNGDTFSVAFLKKDGALRIMKKATTSIPASELKGGQRNYDAVEKGLVTVYEEGVGVRCFALDRVVNITFDGVTFTVGGSLTCGACGQHLPE